MKWINKRNLYYFLFWSMCFVMWCFWVQERIDIFSGFADEYKNIGYYIDTNDDQLSWYVLVTIGKAVFLITIVHYILPNFGFHSAAFTRIFILSLMMVGLEYLAAKGYFWYLKSDISGDLRISWNYGFFDVFSVYLGYGLSSVILVAAKNWMEEYQNLKSLYSSQQAYTQLRKKLDPHFIFNTLNNMYEVAVTSGEEKIQQSLLHLTDTLRYTIGSSDKDDVPVSEEISAIESYIELQKERFDSKEVHLGVDISIDNPQLRISPLIMLNYIENAFEHGYKHGLSSSIYIDLSEKNGQLDLYVKNTNRARRNNENGGNVKTKKLLRIRYPGRHGLKIDNTEDYYSLHLWMQVA